MERFTKVFFAGRIITVLWPYGHILPTFPAIRPGLPSFLRQPLPGHVSDKKRVGNQVCCEMDHCRIGDPANRASYATICFVYILQ